MSTTIHLEHLDDPGRGIESLGTEEAKAALIEALEEDQYPRDLAEVVAEEVVVDLVTWDGARYECGPAGRRRFFYAAHYA